MREIKFRAWDKIKNEYIYEALEYASRCLDIDYSDSNNIGHSIGFNTPEELNRFVFEQFTGLQDKNGKDIYDGDIVYIYDTKEKTNVSFLDGMAMFIFNVVGGEIYTMEDLLNFEKGYEVIGNIHENKENTNV